MTTIATRADVLAVKKEVTEGTPVRPSAGTDFVALQDGFTMSPGLDVLNNTELKASLGASKPVPGLENPTCEFSHYLRHSGVEGQAPDFGDFLEAGFGAVSTASTEYNTVSGSTVSLVKVDVGEGATFERGEPLLIKDGTNGYRIRCLDSISGDDLSLGFNVPTAPGTGVNLGKAVLYKPANSGHPSLTLWHYLGNQGAIQMMSGVRVTSTAIEINAGDFINASFSCEGIAFHFDPILIAATDTKLDFTDDDGTWAATIAAGEYKDPHNLASAIQTAMQTANAGETPTVTYSNSTGKFTIKTTGTLLSLLWNTGTNAANTIGDKIGFSTAADDTGTGATTGYTSDNAQSFVAPYTPSYDSLTPAVAKDNEVMIGNATDYVCFNASKVSATIATPKGDILSVCAVSGKSGSVIQSRAATASVSALLSQYDADMWNRFINSTDTKFQYSFGVKSGGNWVAGKAGALYVPTGVIQNFNVDQVNGLAQVNFDVVAFVNDSGEGECYLGFV